MVHQQMCCQSQLARKHEMQLYRLGNRTSASSGTILTDQAIFGAAPNAPPRAFLYQDLLYAILYIAQLPQKAAVEQS